MRSHKISDKIQDGLYTVEEDFCTIKHVSNAMLKCLEEDSEFTQIEQISLMTMLNDSIWAYNKNLQKFINLVEYGD